MALDTPVPFDLIFFSNSVLDDDKAPNSLRNILGEEI
jgi:hypothetical protein